MILALVAALSIGIFSVSIFLVGLVRVGRDVVGIAHDAVAVMRDSALSDDEREARVQKASLRLGAAFFSIAARTVVALALGFVPIGLFHLLGWSSIEESLSYLSRWDVILVSTIVVTIGLTVWHRLKTSR